MRPTPYTIPFTLAIAAGSDHSMALAADGVVTCWGWDFFRQVSLIPSTERFSRIAASMYGSMGLTRDGRVLVWGLLDQPSSSLTCAGTVVAGGYHAFAEIVDTDGDGPCDSIDNCPTIANPTQADCDNDSVGDACEIAADTNTDGIPDTCQCSTIPSLPACCPGDLNYDADVGGADIGLLLSNWGPCDSACLYDLNNDDKVNGGDLGLLLAGWGPCQN